METLTGKDRARELVRLRFPTPQHMLVPVCSIVKFDGLKEVRLKPLPSAVFERWGTERFQLVKPHTKPFSTSFLKSSGVVAQDGYELMVSLLRELEGSHPEIWAVYVNALLPWQADFSGRDYYYVGSYDPYQYYGRALMMDSSFHEETESAVYKKTLNLPPFWPLRSSRVVYRKNKGASVGFPYFEKFHDPRRSQEEQWSFEDGLYADNEYYEHWLNKAISPVNNMTVIRGDQVASELHSQFFRLWIGHKRNQGRGRVTTGAPNDVSYTAWRFMQSLQHALKYVPWYFSGDLLKKQAQLRRLLRGPPGRSLSIGDDKSVRTKTGILNLDVSNNDYGIQPQARKLFYVELLRAMKSMKPFLSKGVNIRREWFKYVVTAQLLHRYGILVPNGVIVRDEWRAIDSGDPNTSIFSTWLSTVRLRNVPWHRLSWEEGLEILRNYATYRDDKQMHLKHTATLAQLVCSAENGYFIHGIPVRAMRRMFDTEDPIKPQKGYPLWFVELSGIVSRLSYIVDAPLGKDVIMFVAENMSRTLRRKLTKPLLYRVYRFIVETSLKRGRSTGQRERRNIAYVWNIFTESRLWSKK